MAEAIAREFTTDHGDWAPRAHATQEVQIVKFILTKATKNNESSLPL